MLYGHQMPAEEIIAIGTILLVFATLALAAATVVIAIAARKQLPLIAGQVTGLSEQIRLSREAEANAERRMREWESLRACDRYSYDPVLEAACERIWGASDQGTNYGKPEVSRRDMVVVLNYLDSLAVGIQQDLYIEQLLKDHLSVIVEEHVRDFLDSGLIKKEGYEALLSLRAKWNPTVPLAAYKAGANKP